MAKGQAATGMDRFVAQVGAPRAASGNTPSASAVYRHFSAKDGFPELEVKTLYELFQRSVKKFADVPCLGSRPKNADGSVGPFVFKSYKQVGEAVATLASGLKAIGSGPQSRVGIFGSNSMEWMMAMQACSRISAQCVPLYDSLGENAIEYIINHSESTVAFVSSDKLPNLVKALPKTKEVLKSVVYWGQGKADSVEAVKALGYQIYSFEELQKLGAAKPSEPVPPSPDDLCTIMYTSGTTGDPKGVMLKHSAVMTAVANCYYGIKLDLQPGDSLLSYLPLAHIFDRVFEEFFLYFGGTIGYWQGDVNKLLDDVAALKPVIFIGVPRVFDRIHSRVMGMVSTAPFLRRSLFMWGLKRKLSFLNRGVSQKKAAPFFDRLVFSKVAARLGGKVKLVISGGAPLAPHVEEFLRTTMCCPVVQGYGLTETCAASSISFSDFWDHRATVGPPTPCTELRLESVPEMNYDALDPVEPKGEILIRSAANFCGYYKDQKKTDEDLEKDGWFHTGDIAVLTKEGAIKIIDRKKNIFKLSQGEYVAVEKLEAAYKKSTIVEQVWVYGNSFKSCLLAVVVPAQTGLMAWAATNDVSGDFKAVCASAKTNAHVLAELVATAKAEKLKGFEIIKAVHLEPTIFSVEDDLLTPTFKAKRPQLQKKYQKVIDDIYVALKE